MTDKKIVTNYDEALTELKSYTDAQFIESFYFERCPHCGKITWVQQQYDVVEPK